MDRVTPNRNLGRLLSQQIACLARAPQRTSGGGYTDDYAPVVTLPGRVVSMPANTRYLQAVDEGGARRTKDFVQVVVDANGYAGEPSEDWRFDDGTYQYEILSCTLTDGYFVTVSRRLPT